MGQLMVITTPPLAPGFQLAGVETFVVENAEQGEIVLAQLLARDETGLVAVSQSLLQMISPRLRRQIETSDHPVVIGIPDARSTLSQETRRHQLSELMRRIIGFQITFTAE